MKTEDAGAADIRKLLEIPDLDTLLAGRQRLVEIIIQKVEDEKLGVPGAREEEQNASALLHSLDPLIRLQECRRGVELHQEQRRRITP